MPRRSTTSSIRLTSITACLTPALTLVDELHAGFGTPFLQAISNTTLALISAVQNVKRNTDECVQLLENIHKMLYAIVKLHIQSEPAGSLPPVTLDQIGKFTETLRKIHTFLEGQRDGNRIKQFLHQNEMSMLLTECRAGLQEASEVFKANTLKVQEMARNMHKELLDLISNILDDSSSDSSSSMYQLGNDSQLSSNSFSMMPAKPKIFHGRESELSNILKNLTGESPRIAILGPGGIGKTSLAKVALHHPNIPYNYEHRIFVACDSATTCIELAALIGFSIGLNPGRDLTKPVVQYLSGGPPCLLVLDNLETSWERVESRGGVEEFLSLLTDVTHLALIITMRGAERPAKVHWTRPLLPPLNPLSQDAARKTFIDITDDVHDNQDITLLLELTDNMPLAVELLAHLVHYEGCFSVLNRWKTEKTSLLSEGRGKSSNLDSSISVSLSSPRMTSGAKELLSLLSILPDGLSDIELLQSNLPIHNILTCKAVLLQTSLAYRDSKRLKVLVPIREHMQHIYPPLPSLVQPLQKHFHSMLDLYRKHFGAQVNGMIDRITSNLGNLHHILLLGLHQDNADLVDTIYCTLSLNSFKRHSGHDAVVFMDKIPVMLPQLSDHRLETHFIIEMFLTAEQCPISDPEHLIQKVGGYYHNFMSNINLCMDFFNKALTLARACADGSQEARVLNNMAYLEYAIGDYHGAYMHSCQAQQTAQLAGNLYQEAIALDNQCGMHQYLGNYQIATFLWQKARHLLKLYGMDGGSINYQIMISEANAYCSRSEYTEARSIHIKVIQNTSARKDPYNYAMSLLNIAQIDVIIGTTEREVHLNLDKSKTILSSMQSIVSMGYCDIVLADLNLREKKKNAAKIVFQQFLRLSWGKDDYTVAYCLERLADVSRWTSADFNWPYTWSIIYLAYAKKTHQKLPMHKAICFLGDIFILEGNEATAHSLFEVALETFTQMDIHHSRADCMLRLGDIANKRGHVSKAVELWSAARPLFERSLQATDVARIDTRLAAIDKDILEQHIKSLGPAQEGLRMLWKHEDFAQVNLKLILGVSDVCDLREASQPRITRNKAQPSLNVNKSQANSVSEASTGGRVGFSNPLGPAAANSIPSLQ
ncbi:hypothetical protein FB451DRAFT_1358984 [Mycena latifolia]|nr:hypothetical protein FB451DRAFT_1358984 [Mycena latifolia]